ncbi:hypothetical protein [Pedobacter endophyticus]|uniref:Transcription elongation factor, GreA/GreB family n=1 Tax=Pedobacter endophyticus TaxID=2789740 RepID=A0A7S9KY96_9SPHI|nr:hypothetical protein [Pedobacter endophyticus]QPH39044.1 hypothetical protein IZT61_18580 [Pedobacter endophyticus]
MNNNKPSILKACVDFQQNQVDRFESRLDTIKADMNSQDTSPSQTENRNTGKLEVIANYEKELVFAKRELSVLNSIKPDLTSDQVELGAVVYTKDLNFFISVSVGKFSVDGKEFIGISEQAPIYKVMEGLKKGDTFSFNQSTYTIENLY